MAEETVTQQIVREAPEIEAYKLKLLQEAQKLAFNQSGGQTLAQQLPGYHGQRVRTLRKGSVHDGDLVEEGGGARTAVHMGGPSAFDGPFVRAGHIGQRRQ